MRGGPDHANGSAAFTRAMNKKLRINGWVGLGRLIVQKERDDQCVQMFLLDSESTKKAGTRIYRTDFHGGVIGHLNRSTKRMFAS